MPIRFRLPVGRLAILAALAVAAYLTVVAAGQFLHSQELQTDEDLVRQEIQDLQRRYSDLEAVRDYLRSDEFVETVARHELGLVRPGESLAVISSTVSPTPGASGEEAGEAGSWWERLFAR